MSKITFPMTTKTCCKSLKLKTWKIFKQKVQSHRNRTSDYLVNLASATTQISCYHHKLLLRTFWSRTPSAKLLDFQMTTVRFLISPHIVNLLIRCISHISSRERDFIHPSMIKSSSIIVQALRTSAHRTSRLTSPTCLNSRNSTRNYERTDKKCAKTRCLTRFLKFGMKWM